ncbi:MAG: hypothetical protein JRC86_02880 [Deltaproteobacteria bacterium]|nr:hypothetical protein [Deltaproteobacteria bacterium]
MTEQDKKEINILCAEELKGWKLVNDEWLKAGTSTGYYHSGRLATYFGAKAEHWNPVEDRNQAFDMLEEWLDKDRDMRGSSILYMSDLHEVTLHDDSIPIKYLATKPSLVYAICLGMLKAHGINVSKYEESE